MKKKLLLLLLFTFSSINPDSLEITGGKYNVIPLKPDGISGQYYNELETYFYNKTDNLVYRDIHLYNLYRGKDSKFHTESERLSVILQVKTKKGEDIANIYWGISFYRSKLLVDNYINPAFNDYQLASFLLHQSSYYEDFRRSPSLVAILLDDLHRPNRFKYIDRVSPGFNFRYMNGYDLIKFYADFFFALQGKNGFQLSYTDMLVLTLGSKIQFGKLGILIETSLSYNEMLGPSYINGHSYESYLTNSFRMGISLSL